MDYCTIMTSFIKHPRILSPYDKYLCEFSLFHEQANKVSKKYPKGSILIKTITLQDRVMRSPLLTFSVRISS